MGKSSRRFSQITAQIWADYYLNEINLIFICYNLRFNLRKSARTLFIYPT
jgi:hypothetical protein